MNLKNRESNIELLRIIAMLFIIIFHYVVNSDFESNDLTVNNLLIKSCLFLGELGVNLFILITGYYLCKSNISFKKIILIIGEVFFYNLLNIFIAYKIGIIENFLDPKIFSPIITGRYWFITAYLIIYLLSPYFNKLISTFDKKEYSKFLIKILIIWCVIPTIYGFFYEDSEQLIFYNRVIWLSVMYFVGAYIRIYRIKFLDFKKYSILTIISSFILMVLGIVLLDKFGENFQMIKTTETAYFWSPNNLLMLILSVSIFCLFINFNMQNNKIINIVSSTTLGIYLFHDGYIKDYAWDNWFKNIIYIYSDHWYKYMLLTVLLIFITGFIIDIIRQWLERCTIKKILNIKILRNKKSDYQ